MLDMYANQSLAWKHVTGVSDTNEPTYEEKTIKGRKETGFKFVRNAQGEEVVSSAFVMTEAPVKVNDLIDGSLVIAVNDSPGLDGMPLFYEVYLQ